ncbi:MAG: adenylate/guanylate cyclase domain-containing protein [Leptospiraceae bacterium]|nr:adenylate/guanylate cyclase domain-containing protein [Leptospiraceae bacterium]
MRLFKILVNYLILFFISISVISCKKQEIDVKKISAKKGVLDIRSISLNKIRSIELDGEWEIYWNKFLFSEDIKSEKYTPAYIKVPHIWNKIKIPEKKDNSPYGYATLRLVVKTRHIDEVLGLNTSIINTAYNLYVNNKLLNSVGKIGKTKEETIPKYLPGSHYFYSHSDEIEFIIHISNFHNRYGGFRNAFYLGTQDQIGKSRDISLGLDLMVFGSLVIFGLYHIALFLMRRDELSYMFFAVYTLMYAVKTLLENERFASLIIDNLSLDIDLKISYCVVYMSTPFMGGFLYRSFPGEFNKKFINITFLIASILAFITLTTEPSIYSRLAQPHVGYLILVGLYAFYVLIRAVIRKVEGAKIILTGFLFYFIMAAINDSLYSAGIIESFYMSAYALIFLILSQGIFIASRFTKTYNENNKLNYDLLKVNNAYQRFVPIDFLKFLGKKYITEVDLGNQIQKTITIFFADIRSFTELSEKLTPEENFNFLNSYLRRISPVIMKHGGIIDKFMGDGIMAIFPENPSNALSASMEIMEELKLYNYHRGRMNYSPISIGIGLNTGESIMGTVGHDNRMDTTVIGDTVNVASRLESLTKTYKTQILLSESTFQNLENKQKDLIRELDVVTVKGKSNSIKIYECFSSAHQSLQEEKKLNSPKISEAINHIEKNQNKKAISVLKKLIKKDSEDPVPEILFNKYSPKD